MFNENKEAFLDTLRALGRSENTIRAYVSDLSILFSSIEDLNEASVQKYVIRMSKRGSSPASIKRVFYALKTYCNIFEISLNFSKIAIPKLIKREAEYITRDTYTTGIQNILKDEYAKVYDTSFRCAIFEILYNTGLRVSELLSLKGSNYDPNTKYLKIVGKGNKERTIPVEDTLIPILCDNEFFTSLRKISYSTINYWTKKYFGMAYSPHSFRHGYTTKLINNGAKEYTVQKVLGHESFSTTMRYFHMNMTEIAEDLKEALSKEDKDV